LFFVWFRFTTPNIQKQNKDDISLHRLLQTLMQNTKGYTTSPDVAKWCIDSNNSNSFNHFLRSCEVKYFILSIWVDNWFIRENYIWYIHSENYHNIISHFSKLRLLWKIFPMRTSLWSIVLTPTYLGLYRAEQSQKW
jgi:hypothetical protein